MRIALGIAVLALGCGSSDGGGGPPAGATPGTLVKSLTLPFGPIASAYDATTGKIWVVTGDLDGHGISIVDAATFTVDESIASDFGFAIAALPADGKVFVAVQGSNGGEVDAIDETSHAITVAASAAAPSDFPMALAASPALDQVFAFYSGGYVQVIDGATVSVSATIATDVSAPNGGGSLAVDPVDGSKLYVLADDGAGDPEVQVIDTATRAVTSSTTFAGTPAGVAAVAGNAIAVTNSPSIAHVIDPSNLSLDSNFVGSGVSTAGNNVMVDGTFGLPGGYCISPATPALDHATYLDAVTGLNDQAISDLGPIDAGTFSMICRPTDTEQPLEKLIFEVTFNCQ